MVMDTEFENKKVATFDAGDVDREAEFVAALAALRERVAWVTRLTQPFAEKRGGDAQEAPTWTGGRSAGSR